MGSFPLISGTLRVLLWRCRAAPTGILFLIVESTRGAAAVVHFRFAAAAFVPFYVAPACSAIRTERASADLTTVRSYAVPRRFRAEFARGASFPAGARGCALPGPSASNARRCDGNPAGRLEGEKASAVACSAPAADGRNAEPPAALHPTVVAARAPTRRTKRKSRRWRLPLQSWLFGPQAVFIPGEQFIQISNDIEVLRIDLCHHIRFALGGFLRPPRGVRGDCHSYHDNCHCRCCDESPQAGPVLRSPQATLRL